MLHFSLPKVGALALLSAACGMGGCISSGPDLTPGRGVQSGGVVVIPLAAANRTEKPMPLRKVEYTVSIDGGEPISVTRSAEATVHALSTQVIELPVSAPPGARQYSISGEVVYIPARKFWKVMYDEGIYRPGMSFSFQGEIDQAAAVSTTTTTITQPVTVPSGSEEPKVPEAVK